MGPGGRSVVPTDPTCGVRSMEVTVCKQKVKRMHLHRMFRTASPLHTVYILSVCTMCSPLLQIPESPSDMAKAPSLSILNGPGIQIPQIELLECSPYGWKISELKE